MATVPAVAETLRNELMKVEQELNDRYPGALSIDETVPPAMLVGELYYLSAPESGLQIILPITEEDWSRIARRDTGGAATRGMRIVWDMINGLGLQSGDGEFRFENGYCMFVAKELDSDDMSSLEGFTVNIQNSATLTFRFSPVPAEVQEGLLNEEADG
ncbi:MAG TPA: hypothetical protein VJO53_09495 [Candidatus Acidoferrales bacterium]|nr:hypothetical protein [Candidatus Acidoferrales bacterium]